MNKKEKRVLIVYLIVLVPFVVGAILFGTAPRYVQYAYTGVACTVLGFTLFLLEALLKGEKNFWPVLPHLVTAIYCFWGVSKCWNIV